MALTDSQDKESSLETRRTPAPRAFPQWRGGLDEQHILLARPPSPARPLVRPTATQPTPDAHHSFGRQTQRLCTRHIIVWTTSSLARAWAPRGRRAIACGELAEWHCARTCSGRKGSGSHPPQRRRCARSLHRSCCTGTRHLRSTARWARHSARTGSPSAVTSSWRRWAGFAGKSSTGRSSTSRRWRYQGPKLRTAGTRTAASSGAPRWWASRRRTTIVVRACFPTSSSLARRSHPTRGANKGRLLNGSATISTMATSGSRRSFQRAASCALCTSVARRW
mmetsp:Transcript_16506/g.51299  ORF Transcript_16506/g.51299 Transcript_16506/m.51299 type:complete len:280 (-) Transcript_16506:125-964(-)